MSSPAPEGAAPARLRRRMLAAYAAPALPLAMLVLPVYIYLPTFYATDLGLGLALVGNLLLAARLFDVITDPLAGWLSDRFELPLGRRRFWLVAATPLVMLATWRIFVPPDDAGPAYLLGWTFALYGGWTLMLLPYTAWGAELSADYDERSRVAGAREGCIVAGTVLAAAMPSLLTILGLGPADDRRATLLALAMVVVVLLPLAVTLAVGRVPEGRRIDVARVSLRRGLRLVWRNGPFRRLIAAYLANGLANGLTATLFLLFVGQVLVLPERSGTLLLTYFVSGIVSVPLWVEVSRRIGKHRAWAWGMLIACVGFAAVPLLGAGDFWPFMAVCIATGLCLGADLALPGAMQADVVDVDVLRSGDQRTGLYFALWSMATKLALALAVGIAFPVLGWLGFRETGGSPPAALFGLSLLYGAAPVVIKIVAVAIIWRFPLTAERQRRLRLHIERRAVRLRSA